MKTEIFADTGERASAYSKFDMRIPLKNVDELRETVREINETIEKLNRLVKNINHIYEHCYITISASSSDDQNA